MEVLLIEDDEDKIKKINSFLKEEFIESNIKITKSYNSSLVELVKKVKYDIVLMDMSMPTYELESGYENEDTENFAGRDLLQQMKFRNIYYPTIIITQYDTFGESVYKQTLEELTNELRDCFSPTYKATVYYSSAENDWKLNLRNEIKNIFDEEGK